MASSSVLSKTLQSITVTKIRELEKQKQSYNAVKSRILNSADSEPNDARKRLFTLLEGIKEIPDLQNRHTEKDLHNIRRWLVQSDYDPSVPKAKLLQFENQLRSHLDKASRKLDLAHLYSRLLTEWIESPASGTPNTVELEDSGSDESYDVVEDNQKARLEQLRDKFARVVFEPLETDEIEIDNYLSKLFAENNGHKTLEIIRREISDYGNDLLADQAFFNDQGLKWCIKALLKNDLLNDEKKASLKDFLKDDAVLSEIRDVLNMRFRDLKDWDWNVGGEGIPVVPRQSLNGKWRVMMDEDVLQALLTHWIGTRWAVQMKRVLVGTRRNPALWKKLTRLSDEEQAKREFYLDSLSFDRMTDGSCVADMRLDSYERDFFMSPLPSKLFEEARLSGYDEDNDDVPEETSDKKSPKDIKQLLLRTLATEVLMGRSLDGEVAVVQSDFQWFATGIAHSTIFAVMRFFGFQEEWISFFKKVLEPPLNMLDGSQVRIRKRGLPFAHMFEKLLGELVLYPMDLAVAQNKGMILYRFHDDLWLAGQPSQCAAAWKTMEEFAQIMGLEFNKSKTGSVYLTDGDMNRDSDIAETLPKGPVVMNFLVLDPQSGSWTINQEHVRQHVTQLQKQLSESKSVLQWIKTWNSCIGRFFSYTFGEPAHCFGMDHLDKILKTHTDMQKLLFGQTSTVAEHVQNIISTRFGIEIIPDSFILMPASLGGLDLKNPFIPLLLLRSDICKDPEKYMRHFHQKEREYYEKAKTNFEAMSERTRRKKYNTVFLRDEDEGIDPPISWSDAQTFISFNEYTKYRERTSNLLYTKYKYLLGQPKQDGLQWTNSLEKAVEALKEIPDGLPRRGSGGKINPELIWTVQFFEQELVELYGGLEVVDKSLLPLGVLKALKERQVSWQMVL